MEQKWEMHEPGEITEIVSNVPLVRWHSKCVEGHGHGHSLTATEDCHIL